MQGTTYQTTGSSVVRMTTGSPLYSPPATNGYPYGSAGRTAGPSRNRVAIIGATSVALLLVAMGSLAYLRAQDTVTAPVQQPVAVSVPRAATVELADSLADVPTVTVRVPHGADPTS